MAEAEDKKKPKVKETLAEKLRRKVKEGAEYTTGRRASFSLKDVAEDEMEKKKAKQ